MDRLCLVRLMESDKENRLLLHLDEVHLLKELHLVALDVLQNLDVLRQGDCPTLVDAHQGELDGWPVDEELRHQLLKRMDYCQREVDEELLLLPVLGLELQMDCYRGEVALEAHYLPPVLHPMPPQGQPALAV